MSSGGLYSPKTTKHMNESVIIGGKVKNGNFAYCFHSFCKFLKGAFCRKSPTSIHQFNKQHRLGNYSKFFHMKS